MAKRNALFIAAILSFLAALSFLGLGPMGFESPMKNNEATENGKSHDSIRENAPGQPPQSKRTRHDDDTAKALREMEKEFDELLPAQFPDQFSSICDVTLGPSESVILGGFKKADGNYEFTMITVVPNDSGQYKTKATTMLLSPERSSELGFGALVSPAKARIQKSLVVSSASITGAGEFARIMTAPYMTAPANTSATISVGNSESSHVISILVTPQEDSDSIRLRTRIESPNDLH